MKQLEAEISRQFSKIRKGFSGKGAIDTQCRVLADTIYIRFQAEYTPLEKLLLRNTFEHIAANEVGDGLKANLQSQVEETLTEVFKICYDCPKLNVTSVHSAVNVDISCSYVLVVLDTNIEKLYLAYKRKENELEGRANRTGGVTRQSTPKTAIS
jgi:uncharacterized protein YbcI